jgi:DNA-binding NarL/FixJ family response regulator
MRKDIYLVLIADDTVEDRIFFRDAIAKHAPRLQVIGEVGDGEAAIAYLQGEGEYGDRAKHPFPDLLLLDLNMPLKNGIEVLEWIQRQKLPSLRVAMMADSHASMFRQRAQALGVNHLYPKRVKAEDLFQVVKTLQAELDANLR